jgi:hypothetical protein
MTQKGLDIYQEEDLTLLRDRWSEALARRKEYLKDNTFSIKLRVMVFNTTFNNISDSSWRSVVLVEETRVPREIHRPVDSQ